MISRSALLTPANDNAMSLPMPTVAATPHRYLVKCDDCKETIRQTTNVQESYQGGMCDRCKAEQMTKRFEVGHTYMMRSPGDYNAVWTYKVVGRTAKQVTLEGRGKRLRKGIKVYGGAEMCMPLGSYSLAPVLSAEKEVN